MNVPILSIDEAIDELNNMADKLERSNPKLSKEFQSAANSLGSWKNVDGVKGGWDGSMSHDDGKLRSLHPNAAIYLDDFRGIRTKVLRP